MGYLPCPRITGTYESSTVVRVVAGTAGTGRPLLVVGIRGLSPSMGTRGPLLFVGCGTGGGRSLSVVVNGRPNGRESCRTKGQVVEWKASCRKEAWNGGHDGLWQRDVACSTTHQQRSENAER